MGIFVLGASHRSCPVELREKLAFREAELPAVLAWAKGHLALEELAILSTCNRVEIYGVTGAEAFPEAELARLLEHGRKIRIGDYAPYFYRREGKDMVRHLFRVASGLDSLVVGENEILGQVRETFRTAQAAETVHAYLYRALEKALKVGKAVRTETKINEGAVSIPAVAVELAEKIFGCLTEEKVMVLGAGEMSELTLRSLREAGARPALIVSRNEETGKKLAEEFGGERIPFENWEARLDGVDIVIASTSAPHPIVLRDRIREAMERRKGRPLFLVDIAVPRNVEASVDSVPEVYLYNIDDLKVVSDANLKRRMREVRAAEEIVERAVLDYQGWMEQLKSRPVMERFEQFLDEILSQEFSRLARIPGMTDSVRDDLRRRIRAKLLHPPLERIKEASKNGGVSRYLQALHSLFDLDKE